MEDWLESHLLMVATSTCSVMIIQVLAQLTNKFPFLVSHFRFIS